MTPPCNLWVNRLYRIKKTLDISPNKLVFSHKPTRGNDLLNNVIKQVILPSSMEQQSSLQFNLVPILRKRDEIIQHPRRRIPTHKSYLHYLKNGLTCCS